MVAFVWAFFTRFGNATGGTALPEGVRSSADISLPEQTRSSRFACCGSNSIRRPRMLSNFSNSVVYSGSQWSGWMSPSADGLRRSPIMGRSRFRLR